MKKGNSIIITENELKLMISESIKAILSERNRFEREMNMSDTDVINRRLKNYKDDRIAPQNMWDKLTSQPDITDYLSEPEGGWDEYFDRKRIERHRAQQAAARYKKHGIEDYDE